MKSRLYSFGALLLLSVVAVFALHGAYLGKGWYIDDHFFLGTVGNSADPTPASETVGYRVDLSSWAGFLEAFSPWRGWFWRPSMLLYFPAMRSVFGDNPVAFHAVSLAVHGAVAWLLGCLVYRLSNSARAGIFAAVVFVLWRGADEAVWWVASASTLFCALWCLIAAHSWLSMRRTGRGLYGAAAVLALALASTWKNEALFFPVAFVAIDTAAGIDWKRGRNLLPYAPVLAWSFVFAWLETTAARSYAAVLPYLATKTEDSPADRVRAVGELAGMAAGAFRPAFVACLAVAVAVVAAYSIRSMKRPEHRAAVGLFLAGAVYVLVFGIVGGTHSLQSRFLYFPLMLLSGGLGIALTSIDSQGARKAAAASVAAAGIYGAWELISGAPLSIWAGVAVFAGLSLCGFLALRPVQVGDVALLPLCVFLAGNWPDNMVAASMLSVAMLGAYAAVLIAPGSLRLGSAHAMKQGDFPARQSARINHHV